MTDHSQNTKRIAKNTIFLYIRMLVMMVVSLFTFRELLKELGVDDYGTYNVVGGIVILFSFLSTALTTSNQRFIAFHIGKGNQEELKRIFSMIVNVQIVIAISIIFLAETVGLWFINYKMNFEPGTMTAVNWVYQFSILTFVIQILQSPYNSAIIAHEKMVFFSYFSIAEALIRLVVVLLLGLFAEHRLIIYAGLLTASAIVIFMVYFIYCNKSFKVCRYEINWDKSLFVKLTSFSGWNMLGGLGNVAANQGINILFNIFGGVAVNAAMGVSHQVRSAVSSLVSNMQMAFNPQIIKSYASDDTAYFNSLIFRSSRLSFLLIFVVGMPVIICMKTILGLWLTDVPGYSVQFTQLTIVFCMIDAISGPLWTANQASGKVKNYMIIISLIILLNLPVAYIILKLGCSPVYVVAARAVINFITLIFRVIYLNHSINFPSKEFVNKVGVRIFLSILIFLPCFWLMRQIFNSSLLHQSVCFGTTLLLTSILGYWILLIPEERAFINGKILRILLKNK